MISVTRTYRFAASHRLHSPVLSDEENAAVFGKCNNPYGHGHDYVLSVTVTGEIDQRTGLLVPREQLDNLVVEKVLHLFSYRNINLDVPQFSDLVPTTENIATVIANLIQEHWGHYFVQTSARLHRVHVQETERNGFEVLIPMPQANESFQSEGLLVHA